MMALIVGACSRDERQALLPSGAKGTAPSAERAQGVFAQLNAQHQAHVRDDALDIVTTSAGARPLARFMKPTLMQARPGSAPSTGPRVLRRGLVEVDRGWAIEHITESPLGLEQSWQFKTKPAAPSVHIRMAVSDATLVGTSSAGLVFRTSDQHYLRYGDGTWIDARGERWRVPARFVSGAIELIVPETVLDHTVYPAVLDPVISVESTLTPDKLVAAESWQADAGRIALGASSRLMAWSDKREGIVDAVYFTLVDEGTPAATFAQAAGRRLGYASLTGISVIPSIAYASGQYLVAWASYKTISWARVDESGTVLDTTAKTWTVDSGDLTSASVAAFGANFMITWIDRAAGSGDVRAIRIDGNGVALDSQPIAVVSDAAAQAAPSIRASSDGYWIVFQDNASGDNDVRLVRLRSDGSVVDTTPIPIVESFADQTKPDLALDSSGLSAMVVWSDSATLAIHGAAVSAATSGAVTVGTAARISIGSGENSPRVVSSGSGYQVAWISSQNGDPAPQVALLSGSSPVRANGVELGAGSSSFVDIAARGSQVEALWNSQNDQTRSSDLFRQTGTASNSWSGTTYLVSRAATTQRAPHIANNSSRFLVGWETPRVGGKAIEVARVNPLGEFEDATPIQVSDVTDDQRLIGVFSNDTDFLVLWHEQDTDPDSRRLAWRVRARLVSDAGVPASVSETFRNFSSFDAEPADAWIDYDVYPPAYMFTFIDGDDIYSSKINASGARGNSQFVYENDSVMNALSLRATAQYVYLLSASGTLFRITQTMGGSGGSGDTLLALPGSNSNFDVTPNDVLAVYNSQAGTVSIVASGWTRILATGLSSNANPQITIIADGYLVAWNQDSGIVGARVTTDGQVMDAQPATLSQESGIEQLGDTYTDFLNRCMMTYSRPMWVPGIGANRIAMRLIDFRYNDGSNLGAACGTGFECKSGFCVDGVCCNTACGYSNADCQVCAQAAGASADGTCTTLAAGSVCRAASGVCDIVEICNGTGPTCPVDGVAGVSVPCGTAALGLCDKADHCSGTSGNCVAEGLQRAGATCRDARGLCDQPDTCDGATVDCVEKRFGTDHVCRTASDTCDAPEYCDGTSDNCGADAVKAMGTECRAVKGVCDVVETCDGDTKSCPLDKFQAVSTVCRAATGACDVAEVCTGTSATCPADAAATSCGGTQATGGATSGGSSGTVTAGGGTVSYSGGSSNVTGGAATAAGDSAADTVASNTNASNSESGCGCRVAGASPRSGALASILVLLSALRRRVRPRKPNR